MPFTLKPIKHLKSKAVNIFSGKKPELGPVNDIERDLLEPENERRDGSLFRFGSIIKDIKRNWFDVQSLNKKA